MWRFESSTTDRRSNVQGEIFMPKIVRFHKLGGPEVLKIEEETSRQPGKGEVRLQVQAIGLNRAELMFVRGQYLEHPKLPAGIGYEAAGVVKAVGPDVDKNWVAVIDIAARKQAEAAQHRIDILAATNQHLEEEIVQRQATEAALKKSEQRARQLLE